jgi:regulator of sigma E protease
LDSFRTPQRPDAITSSPPPAAPPPPEVDDAALPPRAWLARNAPYLLIFVAILAALYWYAGLDGMWKLGLAGLGLGFVIFIHELGHFAVAKWCDVHVETFSIGFGPALPGCAFRVGETLYKIALFPLGGYVKMLGEGSDSEEGENDPRSYKNKRVGQRMAIISAGVVMNVILACICFVVAYTVHGRTGLANLVGYVETGNQAWKMGVPSGAVLVQIGNRSREALGRPLDFQDLYKVVAHSTQGEKIKLVYLVYPPKSDSHAEPTRYEIEIEPRKEKNDPKPMIGLAFASCLELWPEQYRKEIGQLVLAHSPAAAVRSAVAIRPGDEIVAATDPEHPEQVTNLPEVKPGDANSRQKQAAELARRFQALAGKPMTVQVRRAGLAAEAPLVTVEVPVGQFEFGDTIVAATDPESPEKITPLTGPIERTGSGDRPDYSELHRRLELLAGQFITLRVRHADGSEQDLLVPPAYHFNLGLRMRMGQVVAVREGSPAQRAGVRESDILREIVLTEKNNPKNVFKVEIGTVLPERLPYILRDWAEAHGDVTVSITVLRDNPGGQAQAPTKLEQDVGWDRAWRFDNEHPGNPTSPWGIPELGVAYQVKAVVDEVLPGSPAEAAGLLKNDAIVAYRLQAYTGTGDEAKDGSWNEVDSEQWAWPFFLCQQLNVKEVTLRVARGSGSNKEIKEITLQRQSDETWPLDEDRGLLLMPDQRVHKAEGLGQAMVWGARETWDTIQDVYQILRGLITQRVSPKMVGGPIRILSTAYRMAGQGFWDFVIFLGLISANLAVINFLPIPFLDGGHMMFLIYEKIRGRPASDAVVSTATLGGILVLVCLMIFVLYIDINWLIGR